MYEFQHKRLLGEPAHVVLGQRTIAHRQDLGMLWGGKGCQIKGGNGGEDAGFPDFAAGMSQLVRTKIEEAISMGSVQNKRKMRNRGGGKKNRNGIKLSYDD